VAVSPDGGTVYVANIDSDNVPAIATAANMVVATISVGSGPVAFGVFMIRPSFAGTQGFSNCHG
jgi:YVTN family beta-propeller protein